MYNKSWDALSETPILASKFFCYLINYLLATVFAVLLTSLVQTLDLILPYAICFFYFILLIILDVLQLGRRLFTHLKVYKGAEHPHEAQKPVPLPIRDKRIQKTD